MPATASIPFGAARVVDAMSHGIIRCPPAASVLTAARLMTDFAVHAVVVDDPVSQRPWSIVSDLDVARAAAQGTLESRVAEVAGTPLLTVEAGTRLSEAARLMAEHGLGHLLVVSREEGRPLGVVSTLDVARALTRRSAVSA